MSLTVQEGSVSVERRQQKPPRLGWDPGSSLTTTRDMIRPILGFVSERQTQSPTEWFELCVDKADNVRRVWLSTIAESGVIVSHTHIIQSPT